MAVRLKLEETTTVDPLEVLIHAAHVAKVAADEAQAQYRELQSKVEERLLEEQFKSKTYDFRYDPTKKIRAVYSSNNRIKVDEVGLRKALGAKAFNKVSVQKLDKSLLDIAILEGTVDKTTVQQYVKVETSPSVRFYILEKREEEDVDLDQGSPDSDR